MLPFATLAFSLIVSAAPATKSNLDIALCDAGEHQQFESVTCDVALSNNGDKPIRILDAQALSKVDAIERSVVVPPHGTSYLRATIQVLDSVGFTHRYFRLTTDEPGELASRNLQVQVFASTVLDSAAPALDFGAIQLDELPVAKTVVLSSREVADFRVLAVAYKSDYLDASIAEDGRTLKVSVGKDAPWGIWHEQIKLKINAPQQPEVWVKVDANVMGTIVPDVNPVLLGLMRNNRKNQFLIRLSSRESKDFAIGRLSMKGIKADTKVAACKPVSKGCKVVEVTIAKDQQLGRVSGVLVVELPDFKQVLPIELGAGLLIAADTQVRDMNAENLRREKEAGAQSAVDSTKKPADIDLKQAVSEVIQKKNQDEAPPPGTGPLLRWSVAHQTGYHGYIIYRADAEAGPFLRVNKDLVRTTMVEGSDSSSYQWRDNSAESGKTYWYSIGLVKDDGEKVALGGAQMIVAK